MVEKRRKKFGKLLFILFFFFFTILTVLFFQSSYSKVQTIQVIGTNKLSAQDVIMQSGIAIGDQILLVRESNMQERLLENPIIKEASLEVDFPGNITIFVEEYRTVAYLYSDQQYFYPVLENGYVVEEHHKQLIDQPIITEWNEREYLPSLSKELSQLSTKILQLVSEIRLVPSENDPYKLILYMRDGFEVQTSIVQLAKHLNNYLYVVENINKDEPGVINLSDAGVYYISYKELEESLDEKGE